MIKNKKYIIFDWNGTLVDDAWIFVDILNVLLTVRGLNTITIEDYRNKFCFPIKLFYKNLGVDISKKSFLKLEKEFVIEYAKRMYQPQLFKNVPKLLSKLSNAGFGLSILSASNERVLCNLVNHYQLTNYFDYIVGVDNYGANGKVERGSSLLKKISCNKNEILMIGDTDYDYKVAIQLGLDVILISHGHQSTYKLSKLSNNVIGSLNDIGYDYL